MLRTCSKTESQKERFSTRGTVVDWVWHRDGFLCPAEDPQLAEFLQLMQPRRAGKMWSNEDANLATAPEQAVPRAQGSKEPSKKRPEQLDKQRSKQHEGKNATKRAPGKQKANGNADGGLLFLSQENK